MQLLHSTWGTSGSSFHGSDAPPFWNCQDQDQLFAVLDLLAPLVLTPQSHQNHQQGGLECHEKARLFTYIHCNGCCLCICCELLPYAWAQTYARSHTCTHTHRCSHTTCAPCMHTHATRRAHMHACTSLHTNMCPCTCAHTHPCPHTHMCTPMHPYLCAHAPAHTRALVHTAHMHTHTQALAPGPGAMMRKKEI